MLRGQRELSRTAQRGAFFREVSACLLLAVHGLSRLPLALHRIESRLYCVASQSGQSPQMLQMQSDKTRSISVTEASMLID